MRASGISFPKRRTASLDPNTILLLVVGLNSAAGLLVHALRLRFRFVGWAVAHGLVLAISGLLYLAAPGIAGFVAAAVWFPVVLLPLLLSRWLGRLLVTRRYDLAELVCRIMAILHPADGLRSYPECIRVLGQIHSGDLEGARRRLEAQTDRSGTLARFATIHLLRAEGKWEELATWIESQGDPVGSSPDIEAALHYERALGECGRVEEMLSFHDRLSERLRGGSAGAVAQLQLAALSGRLALTRELLEGPFRRYPEPIREYWTAVAQQVAGESDAARATFERLAKNGSPDLVAGSRRRLDQPLPTVRLDDLSPKASSALEKFEAGVRQELRYQSVGIRAGDRPVVAPAIVLGNVGFFLAEIPGGTENLVNLIELGALVAPPLPGEWWRLVTAGFLHYGVWHLVLNLLGILILGLYVERVWGRMRLAFCYASAMVGANLFALAVVDAHPEAQIVMVGASGGVMGLLGASLAFAAAAWFRDRVAVLKRQIGAFLTVLVAQSVFDYFLPQVSSTLHLAGFAIGFLTALVLTAFVESPKD